MRALALRMPFALYQPGRWLRQCRSIPHIDVLVPIRAFDLQRYSLIISGSVLKVFAGSWEDAHVTAHPSPYSASLDWIYGSPL